MWPRVPLHEVLLPVEDAVHVEPQETYPNFGIYSFGNGLFEKSVINGMTTSASTLYRVRSGRFIYSRLFAFEGSYGIVDDEFDGYYVSNEYPSFEIDRGRVEPAFLKAYFQLPEVWSSIARGSRGVGSRRIRVQPVHVLAHSMPLPPLSRQKSIVERLTELSGKREEVATRLELVERDAEHLLSIQFAECIAGAAHYPLNSVAPLVRREVAIEAEESYTEIGVRSFYKGTFHRRTLQGSEYSWQDLFWISSGDLIFSNIMAWEQAIAIAGLNDAGCVGNHRILTCECVPDVVEAGFLFYYFTTSEGFSKILAASPGTVARNKTLTGPGLMAIEVPVPNVASQRSFEALRTKVATLKAAHGAIRKSNDSLLKATLEKCFADSGTAVTKSGR